MVDIHGEHQFYYMGYHEKYLYGEKINVYIYIIYTYMENQPSWYWIVRIRFYYTYVLFEKTHFNVQ